MRLDHSTRIERLVEAAREKSLAERARYLDGLSEFDPGLRTEVEHLLEADDHDSSPQEPTGTGPTQLSSSASAGDGQPRETRVGPYRPDAKARGNGDVPAR